MTSWPALVRTLLDRRDLTSDDTAWVMDQVIRGDAAPARLLSWVNRVSALGSGDPVRRGSPLGRD
jgi:anthranilate phosphoribosyltransferase